LLKTSGVDSREGVEVLFEVDSEEPAAACFSLLTLEHLPCLLGWQQAHFVLQVTQEQDDLHLPNLLQPQQVMSS